MTCETCQNKTCLLTKKPCKEIEAYLERLNSKNGYSNRHIRRMELPFDNDIIDIIKAQPRSGYEKAGGGWRKKPINMDSYE